MPRRLKKPRKVNQNGRCGGQEFLEKVFLLALTADADDDEMAVLGQSSEVIFEVDD